MDECGRRFGIESTCKLMNSSGARISCGHPRHRFLFVVVSHLLFNLWTYLKWERMSIIWRGGYRKPIHENALTYQSQLSVFINAIEDI